MTGLIDISVTSIQCKSYCVYESSINFFPVPRFHCANRDAVESDNYKFNLMIKPLVLSPANQSELLLTYYVVLSVPPETYW